MLLLTIKRLSQSTWLTTQNLNNNYTWRPSFHDYRDSFGKYCYFHKAVHRGSGKYSACLHNIHICVPTRKEEYTGFGLNKTQILQNFKNKEISKRDRFGDDFIKSENATQSRRIAATRTKCPLGAARHKCSIIHWLVNSTQLLMCVCACVCVSSVECCQERGAEDRYGGLNVALRHTWSLLSLLLRFFLRLSVQRQPIWPRLFVSSLHFMMNKVILMFGCEADVSSFPGWMAADCHSGQIKAWVKVS